MRNPFTHSGGNMPTPNASTTHYDRTIRTLETKLARQRAAVADTEEMIQAVQALKEKETGTPKK